MTDFQGYWLPPQSGGPKLFPQARTLRKPPRPFHRQQYRQSSPSRRKPSLHPNRTSLALRNPRKKRRRRNYSWSELIRRVFAADVTICGKCGGKLRLISPIHPPVATRKILDHLGLPSKPPPLTPAALAEDLNLSTRRRAIRQLTSDQFKAASKSFIPSAVIRFGVPVTLSSSMKNWSRVPSALVPSCIMPPFLT